AGDPCCFPSRRRLTSFSRDWSSDVCSSVLAACELPPTLAHSTAAPPRAYVTIVQRRSCRLACVCISPFCVQEAPRRALSLPGARSEERRVGEEGRSLQSPYVEGNTQPSGRR